MRGTQYTSQRQAAYQTGRAVSRQNYIYGNTAADIDRVLREEPRQRESVAVRKQRERAKNMNLPFVLFLVCAMGIVIFMLANYIRVDRTVSTSASAIGSLERQYVNIKTDNDETYDRIINSVNLDEVRRIAQEELGMHYAREGQIITYTDAVGDYVRQYSDIE